MTKNATATQTCAPSPKQSTRDWIRIPGEIGQARPTITPLGWLPASYISARGVIWDHIQIVEWSGASCVVFTDHEKIACTIYNTPMIKIVFSHTLASTS